MSYFYDIREDLAKWPWAHFMFIYGGRSTGKTYSVLRYMVEENKPFVFMKRTLQDVQILCTGRKLNWSFEQNRRTSDDNNQFRVDIDLSPFAPLNRDFGWNIHAWMVDSKAGIGAFFREDEDGNPVGAPLGFLLAISGVSKYKGFNLVEALPQNEDFYMIFDEFVPPAGTKKLALGKDATEGTALFDLYMTLERDRVSRGLNAIKLICLANPDSLISPIILTMDIIDEIAHMQKRGEDTLLIPEKHLAIHRIKKNKDFVEKEGNQPIYRLMGETEWAAKSLENEFVDADFSCIAKNNLRGYKGIVEIHYKRHKWYIWYNEDKGSYYMTAQKPPQPCPDVIEMSQEKDRLRFLRDYILPIKIASLYGLTTFQEYSMYHFVYRYNEEYL